jgi:hypothetical protein
MTGGISKGGTFTRAGGPKTPTNLFTARYESKNKVSEMQATGNSGLFQRVMEQNTAVNRS